MGIFVKLYDGNTSSRLLGIIDDGLADTLFGVGRMAAGALFVKTNGNGTLQMAKTYTITNETVWFKSGVVAQNGDFLLHGTHYISATRHRTLVARVKNDGSVLWCKTYAQSTTSKNVRIVKSEQDTYFCSSWNETAAGDEQVEVIKINGSGTVVARAQVPVRASVTVHDIKPDGNGLLVYGTSTVNGYQSFICRLKNDLTLDWGRLVRHAKIAQIVDLVRKDANTLILVGDFTQDNSFICTFSTAASVHPAQVYSFVPGVEKGPKKIVKTSTAYYVLQFAESAQRSVMSKFDLSLTLLWEKELDIDGTTALLDFINDGATDDELSVVGYQTGTAGDSGLIAHTDKDFKTCVTMALQLPEAQQHELLSLTWSPRMVVPEIVTRNVTLSDKNTGYPENRICPVSLELDGTVLFQSPYIYLEAAGSDESDDSVKGFHLRWDLLRKLGETHLPKGNYAASGGDYPTTIGFNRPDDYVRIYKAPFTTAYYVDVNFSVVPSVITEVGLTRVWRYNGFQPVAADPTYLTDVSITFDDRVRYDIVRSTINPNTHPYDFVKAYSDLMTVRIVDKLFFGAGFTLGASALNLRVETITVGDVLESDSRRVSTRRTHTFASNPPLVCDNIEAIRFDFDSVSVPSKLRLIAYDDYIYGTNLAGNWIYVDKFALDDGNSDTNTKVFKRLEDDAHYTIDGRWRKYNEPDVNASGEFRVSVANYRSRWTMPEGLKEAVVTYLDTSITDVKAVVTHTNSDPVPNSTTMDISYLDMLNFVSLDYHVARMLGLGHIDHDDAYTSENRFIYLMHYVTEGQLENELTPDTVQHYYMTPPLTILDHRLPPEPVQKPVTYGLFVNNGTDTPTLLTDVNGYNPYGAARYIQINREEFQFEKPLETFFQYASEFSLWQQSVTVLMGLEYANDTIAAGNPFERPEITNDASWLDDGGLPEVTGIPLSSGERVYIHEETTEGIHHYALYSVNWFSRASQISNKEETDYTVFPPLNTLLPPSNFAVHLIQKETPLIFTTQQEQLDLAAITDADKTYVRITFDWNEVHNKAYQTADGVELFWRQSEPLIVQGKIASGPGAVVEDPATHTVTVQTSGYLNASINQTVTPEIASGDESRFTGSRLTIDGKSFELVEVVTPGVNPVLKLRQIRVTASIDANNDNIFTTTESWISPEEDERFFIAENLDDEAGWDEQLAAVVSIEQFSAHTETVTYDDGTTQTFTIGGLTGSGVIADIPDPDPAILTYVPVGGPSQVPTGVYTITFDSELLPPHPNGDPDAVVDYVGGSVRLLDTGGEIRRLTVWKIEESGGTTKLTAFDPTFALEREDNGDFVLTAGQFTPLDGYTPIQTGSVPFINFHPSYRVYVKHGGSGSSFIDDSILPGEGEGMRTTFMVARSVDSTITPAPLKSYMTPPAGLLAREIVEPVPPGEPSGPLFATRPNFYGKATYTFDVEVGNPFALIFYRANERKILDQLYTTATADAILEDLANLSGLDAGFSQDRWKELVNMVIDTTTNTFKEYTPGGYRFPMPDNENYKIPHANPAVAEFPFATPFTFADTYTYSDPDLGTVNVSMIDLVKDCIDGAFLPLTEIPAVYKQLQDSEFQTSGRKPVLRNPQTGARYTIDDEEYDPWPMAFRFEKNGDEILQYPDTGYGDAGNDRFVRFTDFTLDGASANMYFYFAVELSNTLAVSDRSPVAGPIQLVNSAPAEAPGIKTIKAQLYNSTNRIPTAVLFELNEFVASEGIRKFDIYRSTSPEKALSVRTMELAKSVDYGEAVVDDFRDKPFPLYGEPLFYRIVALREISNEQGQMEMIPSLASNVALTNVVDMLPPPSPVLEFTHNAPTGSPIQLPDVVISFAQTAYNASYFLYKQNSEGNWTLIHQLTPAGHANASTIVIDLADTDLGSNVLPKQDANFKPIYHTFRVDVENSSGMPNVEKKEFTL